MEAIQIATAQRTLASQEKRRAVSGRVNRGSEAHGRRATRQVVTSKMRPMYSRATTSAVTQVTLQRAVVHRVVVRYVSWRCAVHFGKYGSPPKKASVETRGLHDSLGLILHAMLLDDCRGCQAGGANKRRKLVQTGLLQPSRVFSYISFSSLACVLQITDVH